MNKDYNELVEEVQALKNDIGVIRIDNTELRQLIDETVERNRDLSAYRDRLEQKNSDCEYKLE